MINQGNTASTPFNDKQNTTNQTQAGDRGDGVEDNLASLSIRSFNNRGSNRSGKIYQNSTSIIYIELCTRILRIREA